MWLHVRFPRTANKTLRSGNGSNLRLPNLRKRDWREEEHETGRVQHTLADLNQPVIWGQACRRRLT